MKTRLLVWAAAVVGLAAFGFSQNAPSGAGAIAASVPPEQAILQRVTALAIEGRLNEAWQVLLNPRDERASAEISVDVVGWRIAAVAGSLRNLSDYRAADAFARFALLQSWTADRRTLSRGEVATVGYWCAWLASEILSDQASALEWIEEAAKADPESERIRVFKDRISEAERSFPKG